MSLRLYLDNSVLNRPYDDQRQPRIWLETLALSIILQMAEAGEVELVKSPVHTLENDRSPLAMRRQWVERCLALSAPNSRSPNPSAPAPARWKAAA
jgi:hypothetical protein